MKAKGLALVFDGGAQRNYGTSFEHDRNLQLIRRILESSPCISGYLSETEVRKILAERHGIQHERDQRYKVPDALFNLRLSDATLRVALELELSVKSIKRTRRLMELQATSQDFENTFYVTGSDKLMERLAQVLAELRKNNHRVRNQGKGHGFYFILLADLLKGQSEAVFQGEGTSFTLSRAGKAVDLMIEDINLEFTGGKINRTDLLSWIAIHFETEGYTDQVKQDIRKKYFDQVAYLSNGACKDEKSTEKRGGHSDS